MDYRFDVRTVPAQQVLFVRRTCKQTDIGETMGQALPEVDAAMRRLKAQPSGPPFCRYAAWRDTDCDIETGFPVASAVQSDDDKIVSGQIGGGSALHTTHIGPYDKLSEAYAAGTQWLTTNKREAAGPPWEVYVTDPGEIANPDEWKTEIYWPLT